MTGRVTKHSGAFRLEGTQIPLRTFELITTSNRRNPGLCTDKSGILCTASYFWALTLVHISHPATCELPPLSGGYFFLTDHSNLPLTTGCSWTKIMRIHHEYRMNSHSSLFFFYLAMFPSTTAPAVNPQAIIVPVQMPEVQTGDALADEV